MKREKKGKIKAFCQNENPQKLVRSMCQSQLDQRLSEEVNQDDNDFKLTFCRKLGNYWTTSISGILGDRI